MKKSILLLSFMTCAIFVTAQTDFPFPELLSNDSIELLTIQNGQLITIKRDQGRNFFLSVNGKTDTLKINFPFTFWRIIPVHHNSENSIYIQFTYGTSHPVRSIHRLNLETKNFTEIKIDEWWPVYFVMNNSVIFGKHSSRTVYAYCMRTETTDSVFSGYDFGIIRQFLIGNKALVNFWESGSIMYFALFDFNTKEMIEPIEALDGISIFDMPSISIYFKDISGKYYNVGLFWVDENFNVVQPTLLPSRGSYATYTLGDSLFPFSYRISRIERRPFTNQVWVATRFSLPFDKALYNIYHNTLLERDVVETFDAWELRKLRNMIFAKHGFQFESEYLQAFFNLFHFYNHIAKTRNVNHLLTPVDRQNLALIQEIERARE